MISDRESVVLYASYKVVVGYSAAIIVDIQNGSCFSIDKKIANFLNAIDHCTLLEIVAATKRSEEIILSDLKVLEELGLIFFSQFPERYPKISETWDHYSTVTNAIVEVRNSSCKEICRAISELSSVDCEHVEIRWKEYCDIELLLCVLSEFKRSRILSIQLILEAVKQCESTLVGILKGNPKILKLSVCVDSVPCNEKVTLPTGQTLFFLSRRDLSNMHCGVVDVKHFTSNIHFVTESFNHNSCLNRKISIDAEGNIKNCPSMKESFGNIKDTTLAEAIEKPGFKKYWDINKDKIHVCKDCEFRYICTDCRAYVEDPEDILSKPLKCGYNPYTGEWSEWSTNPLKQKAIDFYGMREILPKT